MQILPSNQSRQHLRPNLVDQNTTGRRFTNNTG
jgi:hypothetical protein